MSIGSSSRNSSSTSSSGPRTATARCLAFPDGGHGDPERRLAHRARVADGGVRQRRQGRRRLRPRPLHAHHATLPMLTYLQNWDKLFKSPFKSDVYFFSTRQQIDQRWGTPAGHDPRQGVRRRAPARFGNYAYHVADPRLFHHEISGTRERYTTEELEPQLRGLIFSTSPTRSARAARRSSTSPPTRSSSPRRCRRRPRRRSPSSASSSRW